MSDEPTREELLDAVIEANDLLADEGIPAANRAVSHDEIRASTIEVCDSLQDAHLILADVDPTRHDPGKDGGEQA